MNQSLLSKIQQAKQDHLLTHFNNLEESEKQQFQDQLQSINFDIITQLFELTKKQNVKQEIQEIKDKFELKDQTPQIKQELFEAGLKSIANGEISVIIMGGGQGSRLGFDHPKGMYDIKMPSGKSIYQYHCEKLLKAQKLAQKYNENSCITLYIMTSSFNHDETIKFFEKNKYFQLDSKNVKFFQQGQLPALDYEGKILLQDKNNVCFAPNGNGAVYEALVQHKIIEDINIKYIHLLGVDNVLAKIADPSFIGFTKKQDKQISCKYVTKRNPEEKVGVHVLKNNRPYIVEYSEMNKEQTEELNEKGQLKYSSSGIVNTLFKFEFIEDIVNNRIQELIEMYHVANKNIKHYDINTKQMVQSKDLNGFKFELFFFDCYQFSDSLGLMEADRSEEFAPVKNATGIDSPESARDLMSKLHQKWLRQIGMNFIADADGNNNVEVDALVTYEGEGLDRFLAYLEELKGFQIEFPFHLQN